MVRGRLTEWFKEPVLKTGVGQLTEGSNPSPSAIFMTDIQRKSLDLYRAYQKGLLGNQTMPEDTHPSFSNQEERLAFFTLPMALNYQRNSYKLWEAATDTFSDSGTKQIFSVEQVAKLSQDELRHLLLKHKLALQPNRHIDTWLRLGITISQNWGSITGLLAAADNDFLKLQQLVQAEHKKGFPYLSGPKIFHYWSYILGEYCAINLSNREFIQIAPDTHIIKCSIRLGVLNEEQSKTMSRDEISKTWRSTLAGTGLSPIDMHAPLWFWSRNGFKYEL